MQNSLSPCPCGLPNAYDNCCGKWHSSYKSGQFPSTPEKLMRSRFSAFKLGKIDYLIATHHPSKQTANENRELQEAIKNTQWLKLYILDAPEDDGNKGHVEFHAIFSHRGDDQAIANQASSNKDIGLLHERSNFIYEDNRWLYLDGEIFDTPMPSHYFPSRNDLCWCSSGKKYKKCCGS